MVEFFLVSIFIAAALSLLSYLYCWYDIQGGQPHIISLRQITNIMDRNRLNQMFGPPDEGYRYLLQPEALAALIRRRRGFFYSEVAADSACLLGAYMYMTGQVGMGSIGWFIALAGLCQGINFAWSITQMRKWAHQIHEEMADEDEL